MEMTEHEKMVKATEKAQKQSAAAAIVVRLARRDLCERVCEGLDLSEGVVSAKMFAECLETYREAIWSNWGWSDNPDQQPEDYKQFKAALDAARKAAGK